MRLAQLILMGALRCYRWFVSPLFNAVFTPMGFGCRFHPTCSQYALEAVQRHGAGQGTLLAIRRVCRCHPWGGCGCDPVPDAQIGARTVCPRADKLSALQSSGGFEA